VDLEMNATGAVVHTQAFHDTVRARRATRGFLAEPVSADVIRKVLEDAQRSPSNCNTQPWRTHVVSGAKRAELADALQSAYDEGRFSLDFTFDEGEYFGRYAQRRSELGKHYYGALGVAREDTDGRRAAAGLNVTFFGAPHVALLFMPSFGDNVRVAADVGMHAQTFLLSLAAHGLAGLPQTTLGCFADTVREVLGIPEESKLLFGISFGHPDEQAPANSFRMTRAPLSECVNFHQ
jgi:nitroreductase